LIARIRQGLMLSNASMLPLGALMVGLAVPIVALIYERGAFNADAADLVGQLLMAYGIGMPAYLARDVLVRVFYALGDGVTPFRWSLGGIGMNALFCWLFVGGPTPWAAQTLPLNFGAAGLVMATVAVNLITCCWPCRAAWAGCRCDSGPATACCCWPQPWRRAWRPGGWPAPWLGPPTCWAVCWSAAWPAPRRWWCMA
jgi:Na+-driven multidrug efflux pump